MELKCQCKSKTSKIMKINIVSKHLIKPSSPTPSHLREYKLSFIDEIIPHSYFPLILYYSRGKSSKNFGSSELSEGLRKSLSETLTEFYPLAGRIKGQTSIDCNDEGVCYSEASVENDLADVIEFPDIAVLDQLIPCKSSGNISDAKELLAVQVTFFSCGGIAIGICQSHRIADGCTLCTFIKAWAAKSCGASNMISPVFDAAKFFPPRDTPDFRPNPKAPALQPPAEKLVNKRFVFDSSAVDLLKTRVMTHFSEANPSRVEVVSALIWKSWMVAKGIQHFDISVAFQPVNLRGRIIPSLPEYSFGNIFQMAKTVTNGDANLTSLVKNLRVGVREIDNEYGRKLLGENGFEICKNNFKEISKSLSRGDVHVLRYSSWCGFQLYRVDFGWGNAIWLSSASYSSKNHVFLLDSSSSGIEAWIAMAEKEMARFEQALLDVQRCI